MNRSSIPRQINNLTLVAFLLACDKTPFDAVVEPPALETIPYEALGSSGKIAFSRTYWQNPGGEGSGVHVIDISTRSFALVPGTLLATDPTISPNGELIAFTAFSAGDFAFDVFTIRVDGTQRVQLTKLDGQDVAPSWTPDGSAVIGHAHPWTRGNIAPHPYVYRQPVDQPQRTTILWTIPPRMSDLDPPTAMPEGRVSLSPQDVFVFSTWPREIYTFTLDGGNDLEHSVQQPQELHGPAWSPDGQVIAFLNIVRSGFTIIATRVELLSPANGNVSTVIEVASSGLANAGVGNTNLTLCWLDNDRIIFVNAESDANGPFSSIYLVRRNGTDLTRITSAPQVTDRSVSCSPV